EGTLEADLVRLAHATVATTANVAQQSDQDEETVRPATALGFLAVTGDAPLVRYRERAELWALAFDDSWGRLQLGRAVRLAPSVAVLPESAALALKELAKPVELPPTAGVEEGEDALEPITIERAAKRLGQPPFAIARALG